MSSEPAFCSEFVARLKSYERKAWQEAFAVLHSLALRGATSANLYLSLQDREEVASEALADLARQIGSLNAWSEISALTFVMARRRAIDRLRRLSARKRQTDGPRHGIDPSALHLGAESDVPDPGQWAEISELVANLVDGLGEPAASLVRGYSQEGLTYNQLAQRTGLPLGTVAASIYRSLRRLERELGSTSKLARELLLYLRSPTRHERPALPANSSQNRS